MAGTRRAGHLEFLEHNLFGGEILVLPGGRVGANWWGKLVACDFLSLSQIWFILTEYRDLL